MNINLSIILIFFKEEKKQFLNLLNSLYKFLDISDFKYEIIIVNNSTDSLYFIDLADNTFIIDNRKNVGVAVARNQGVLKAKGDVLFFLDSDTYISIDKIIEAYNYLIAHSFIDAIGLKIISSDGRIENKFSSLPSRLFIFYEMLGIKNKSFIQHKPQKVDFLTGAAFMVRKTAFQKVGFFDENFSIYGWEDTDWCLRAKKKGLNLFYYPYVSVLHFSHTSATAICARGVEFYLSGIYYYKKYFGTIWALVVSLFILLFSLLRLIVNTFKPNRKQIRKQLIRLIKMVLKQLKIKDESNVCIP